MRLFCIGIHALSTGSSRSTAAALASSLSDDGYAIGPAHMVFAAVERFVRRVGQLLDLEGQVAKLRCSSRLHPLAECRHHIAAGIPIGTLSIADGGGSGGGWLCGWPTGGSASGPRCAS